MAPHPAGLLPSYLLALIYTASLLPARGRGVLLLGRRVGRLAAAVARLAAAVLGLRLGGRRLVGAILQ